MVEALIGNYLTVLKNIDADGPAQAALVKAAAMTGEAVSASSFRRAGRSIPRTWPRSRRT
ncbi:hypothetical protein [Streptomyces eurocidicus]|uniref:Uncharacterized protein n=1 Tax=Streptomyces eurocidicus TaxID=66423 RepID=A0A7W8B995_STREU|nr:hypothetical protein [Streptomyces eurocidicus]MBB5118001.1 hypothetical protein [Streptomyces eurocidicus]MBF6053980.1 hypothetical protein [Streptomyces eurocidicus]